MFGGSSDDTAQRHDTVAFSSSAFADKLAGTAAGDFWTAEVAWQREELSKAFTVQIADPQTVGGTFSSYTIYLVTSTVCPEGVRRRYSDFDWLREVLVARYHGIAVPLMPEKRVVGNQSAAFIEERMAGLEQFMLLLLSCPYLRLDATLRMFLSVKGTAEFDQAKKAANSGVGADPASNPGLARWFGVLRTLPLPVDADAAATELTAVTDDLEAKVVATLGAVTRYWEASKATAEALKSMRDTLNDWSGGAATAAAGMSDTLRALKDHTTTLAGKVKKAGDAFSAAHDLAVFSPNEIQIFLLDGLVTETHRLRSLRALMAVREAAQGEYSKAWVAQDKLHFQAKQWRDKGREDRALALDPKIAEAVGAMKRAKERLDDITKGALYIESDKVSRARSARFIAMMGQYAALCIASGVRGQELWSGFMTAMELDQNTQVTDAQATLTGASSMHGLDAVAGSPLSLPVPTSVLNGSGFKPAGGAVAAAGAAPALTASSGEAAAPAASAALFTGSASSAAPESSSVDL